MAGIREQKKENTKRSIKNYAIKAFKEKGYAQVKTSEIAKNVGIGEGTLFNYFESKAQLFIESIFGDFKIEKYCVQSKIVMNDKAVFNEIINLIDFYIGKMAMVDKQLLREYFSIVYSDTNESSSALKSITRMDEIIINDLKELLYKENIIEINNDSSIIDIVATCIYSCVVIQFTRFAYSENIQYTDFTNELKKQIIVIVKGNLKL